MSRNACENNHPILYQMLRAQYVFVRIPCITCVPPDSPPPTHTHTHTRSHVRAHACTFTHPCTHARLHTRSRTHITRALVISTTPPSSPQLYENALKQWITQRLSHDTCWFTCVHVTQHVYRNALVFTTHYCTMGERLINGGLENKIHKYPILFKLFCNIVFTLPCIGRNRKIITKRSGK